MLIINSLLYIHVVRGSFRNTHFGIYQDFRDSFGSSVTQNLSKSSRFSQNLLESSEILRNLLNLIPKNRIIHSSILSNMLLNRTYFRINGLNCANLMLDGPKVWFPFHVLSLINIIFFRLLRYTLLWHEHAYSLTHGQLN